MHIKKLMTILIACAVILSCFAIPTQAAEDPADAVSVKDFGAIPDDGKDDSTAIQSAFDYAVKNGAKTVKFDAGVYDFSENPIGGVGKDAYLHISGAKNLTLEGATDKEGKPATEFVRFNPGGVNADLRQLLYAQHASGFTVRNIEFKLSPNYYTAGEIVKTSSKKVTVRICDGYPLPSEMNATKANLPALYDKTENAFYQQRLIWTVEDTSDAPEVVTPDASQPQIVEIENKEMVKEIKKAIRKKGKENLIMFWFQGHYPDSCQAVVFQYCEDVLLENLSVSSSTGFAITCNMCRNITYRNMDLSPEAGGYATAPRDALKLYGCGGDILMENLIMNGFEDDGQNCHGLFSTVKEVTGENSLILNLSAANPKRPDWLRGSVIRFLSHETNDIYAVTEIESAEYIDGKTWKITTKDALPDGIVCSADGDFKGKTAVEIGAYIANSWTVRNCTIKNTYRALKISAQNVLVENNTFENNVYDIYMGAENDEYWHESQNPVNVTIKNNTFKNPLSTISIDMDFHAYVGTQTKSLMKDIYIYNNKFINCNTALWVKDAKNVYFYSNEFENVKKQIKVDPLSTESIYSVAPENAEGTESEDQKALIVYNRTETAKKILIPAGVIIGIAAVVLIIVLTVKKLRKKAKTSKDAK